MTSESEQYRMEKRGHQLPQNLRKFKMKAEKSCMNERLMTETGGLNAAELYRKPGELTKDKGSWKESIPYVSSLLAHESVKIQAKAIWLLGEMRAVG